MIWSDHKINDSDQGCRENGQDKSIQRQKDRSRSRFLIELLIRTLSLNWKVKKFQNSPLKPNFNKTSCKP
jgi:hypothetical protein